MIKSRLLSIILLFTTSVLFSIACNAQNIKVVDKTKIYRRQIKQDSQFLMVELKSVIPSMVYDLRYGTANNFTGKILYPQTEHTFLRKPAADALFAVQKELQKKGLGLKIYDAYRPYEATKKMWQLIKDERYVANPAKGSGHNRGLAVDLTLINLNTGEELDMGTGFDHFSDTAHHAFKGLSNAVLENRNLLKTTMETAGFKALSTEWWHYSWPNDKGYDVLDMSFKKLKQFSR